MLRHLLNFFFPFLMMTFAAGATIGDVSDGGGAGDGSGDGSGGDVPGSESDDTSEDSADETGDDTEHDSDLPNFDDDTEEGAEDKDNADPDALVALGDGRQVPQKFKKLFDLAKKAGLEKEAKQLYFAQQRLTKAIPGGINAAIELANTVEELGGVEGIEAMRGELETYQSDATDFESNPAKWVESGFKENSEAALKSWAHSLDYVADNFPEHYDHYVAKIITNDVGGALPIRELHALLKGIKDNPRAQELAKHLSEWWNDRIEKGQKVPEKKPDAQSKAITDKQNELSKKEMSLRESEARTEIKPALQTAIGAAIRAEGKARNLDLAKLAKTYEGEYFDLVSKIHQRINEIALKDKRFIRNYQAHLTKGEIKKAVKLANDKHAAIIGEAVREVFAKSGVFRGKKGAGPGADKNDKNKPAASPANADTGWQRVKERPKNSEIDFSRTTQRMQIDGKYVLRDGKKLQVVY